MISIISDRPINNKILVAVALLEVALLVVGIFSLAKFEDFAKIPSFTGLCLVSGSGLVFIFDIILSLKITKKPKIESSKIKNTNFIFENDKWFLGVEFSDGIQSKFPISFPVDSRRNTTVGTWNKSLLLENNKFCVVYNVLLTEEKPDLRLVSIFCNDNGNTFTADLFRSRPMFEYVMEQCKKGIFEYQTLNL